MTIFLASGVGSGCIGFRLAPIWSSFSLLEGVVLWASRECFVGFWDWFLWESAIVLEMVIVC